MVPVSGGIESTALAFLAHKEGREPIALCFDDSTPFWEEREKPSIKAIFNLTHIRLVEARLADTDDLCTFTPGPPPHPEAKYICGFKMLMGVTALAYAEKFRCNEIWLGHMVDNTFRDESTGFLHSLSTLYQITYGPNIQFKEPFKLMQKWETVKVAKKLGVPFSLTLSCNHETLPSLIHCGKCSLCKSRRQAFKRARVKDPTKYEVVK